MVMRIIGILLFCVGVLLATDHAPAQEIPAKSILVLDQSDLRGPFYYEVFSGLRSVLNERHAHVTLYNEGLDLSRFRGEAYEESLLRHFEEKYRMRIGVVVAVGTATLELALRWRPKLWPDAPIVFALVEENKLGRFQLPADVTGHIIRIPLSDSIKAARAIVPNLQTVVFVGDRWENLPVYQSWKQEIPEATAGLKVIDLVGRKMREVREQVATLPERSAIVYSAMYSDGEGIYFPPATAVAMIAEKANRPMVAAAETFIAPGATGGFVLVPRIIGAEAGRLALRLLNGEPAASIPPAVSDSVKPIFNWRQMQRFNVAEAKLPPNSEIRFRDPTAWEKYRWEIMSVIAVILVQAGLISILLHERGKRSKAEFEARHRMTELAHVNRQATAGELSSSIAHELNQPLGAILTNTETAELILNSPTPDLDEVKEILADIKRDDLRANEVIRRMRSFLKRAPYEDRDIDLNDAMSEVFDFISVQASARNVALYLSPSPEPLRVKGDPVQLQQVILNLIVNSMDAMSSIPYGRTVICKTEKTGGASAIVSISDTGPGIPPEKLNEIFDPFFTTKKQGMGIGLSIARTIVLAHKGRIWAENQSGGGAVFRLMLPLAVA